MLCGNGQYSTVLLVCRYHRNCSKHPYTQKIPSWDRCQSTNKKPKAKMLWKAFLFTQIGSLLFLHRRWQVSVYPKWCCPFHCSRVLEIFCTHGRRRNKLKPEMYIFVNIFKSNKIFLVLSFNFAGFFFRNKGKITFLLSQCKGPTLLLVLIPTFKFLSFRFSKYAFFPKHNHACNALKKKSLLEKKPLSSELLYQLSSIFLVKIVYNF